MKTIFIHGGPGLNSFADKALLSSEFEERSINVFFWNEPKVYESEDPYIELCNNLISFINSFGEKVNLIAHSAGCGFVASIIDQVEKSVNRICFLSPAVDSIYSGDRIIQIALDIYSKTDKDNESLLRSMLPSIGDTFNETRKNAVLLGFGSNYFPQNFIDFASFEKYFSYLVGDNAFNLDNHFLVTKFIPNYQPTRKSSVPVICFLGEKDPVFEVKPCKEQVNKAFSDVDFITLENSSHYPHIENTDEVLSKYLIFVG